MTTPGTILVGLGQEYKMYDRNNPLQATVMNRILKPGEQIRATIGPKYGKWDQSFTNKYRYELVHRVYTSERISTLRGEQTPIVHSTDTIVSGTSITGKSLDLDTK